MNDKLNEMLKKLESMTDAERQHLLDTLDAEFAQDENSGFQWHTSYLKLLYSGLTPKQRQQIEQLNIMNWEL